ncbi:MAG: hypothetical protein NVS3B10_03970 [Polyangiales bacterium]
MMGSERAKGKPDWSRCSAGLKIRDMRFLGRLLSVAGTVATLAACGLGVSFDDYDTSIHEPSIHDPSAEASGPRSYTVPELTAPDALRIAQGASVTVDVSLRPSDDEDATVITELPPGVTGAPGALSLGAMTPSGQLTLSAAKDAPTGSFKMALIAFRADSEVRSRRELPLTIVGASGSIDTSFGTAGVVTLPLMTFATGAALSLNGAGQIFFAYTGNDPGSPYTTCLWTERNPDGSVTPGFPAQPMPLPNLTMAGGGLEPTGGGGVLLTQSSQSGSQSVSLRRVRASDGTIDPQFGASGSGVVVAPLSTVDPNGSRSIVISGGLITVVGYGSAAGSAGVVARYDASGKLDGTFGVNGLVTWQSSRGPYAIVQQDTSFIVADTDSTSVELGGHLARISANGARDMTFGAGGFVAIPSPARPQVSVQPDGGLIVTRVTMASLQQLLVERYDRNGTKDASFGGGTPVVAPFGFAQSAVMFVSTTGQIYVAGAESGHIRVVRYLANGNVDRGFAANGIATGSEAGAVAGIVVEPMDDKIVIGGASGSLPGNAFLTRLWP